ncbi:MAG: DUF4105 domain-containing protein [Candidatus Acidiferrales bacterium]
MMQNPGIEQRSRRLVGFLCAGLAWFAVSLFMIWAVAALCFDLRIIWLRIPALSVFVLSIVAVLFFAKRTWLRLVGCAACSAIVLLWWLSIEPSNNRAWQADVSQTAFAEVQGDLVTIHNVRNCDYRAEFDYTCQWETRTYDLSQLRGVDAYIVYWGSPWIAHTMLSFEFGKDQYIVCSIETRKAIGQFYSAIRGFFRQYELIYLVSDERDIVRLRTNYRQGEEVYLYHLNMDPVRARARFLEYIDRLNELNKQPEWYNALTRNCTTSIFAQREASRASYKQLTPWDWQILLNGKLDEKAYREGAFAGNFPFAELKARAHINPVAHTLDKASDFSTRIREGRP